MCSQAFLQILPSDLLFQPTWPSYDFIKDFMQTNILTKFDEDWMKIVASSVFTSKILQILRFDLVTYILIPPNPFKNSFKILSRQTFWPSLVKIILKMWSPVRSQVFPKIWPRDLLFDPRWPDTKLIQTFMQTNILTKFGEDWAINVVFSVFTSFFKDLT